jgi:hypothetical protein
VILPEREIRAGEALRAGSNTGPIRTAKRASQRVGPMLKLTPLLRLKYHDSIADAVADLGRPDEIGKVFAGFQKCLYLQEAAA